MGACTNVKLQRGFDNSLIVSLCVKCTQVTGMNSLVDLIGCVCKTFEE